MAPAAAAEPQRGGDAATLLGGHGVASFLRRFWQKEALLVRGALPGFAGIHSAAELKALAQRDDVESRLVVRDGARWSFEQGPFRAALLRALPPRDWTLLVQGLNLHSAPADQLLRRFAFIPYARLDDLMVSLAAPGGGVGPHFDSYDVFLLQGFGRRRWRYGRQDDLAIKARLPVRILRRFTPSFDEVLAPGDMLYLPPQYAHDGVAVDTCTTYSIGFRAAPINDLACAFVDFLRDELALPGRYADPDLAPTREPARIGAPMVDRCARELDRFAQQFSMARRREGLPFGGTRIGINAGVAIVGNFGGGLRFDYTAHGDAVNTAARLETANKILGTRICVSEAVASRCPGFVGRPAGTLLLKGKTEPIRVFEPLPEEAAGSPALHRWQTAFHLLETEDPAAEAAFAAIVEATPDDRLAHLHLGRLRRGESGVLVTLSEK